MAKPVYNKQSLSLSQQADLLLTRGLSGVSKEELIEVLSRIGYYRLRGYAYPYQDNFSRNSPFLPNACWQYIKDDYVFDSKLRNLVMDALSHIEVAVRSQLAYQPSIAHGSRWYEDPVLCHSRKIFSDNLQELQKCWSRSREVFKSHYETNYDTSVAPPAWMIFGFVGFLIVGS